MKYYVKCEPAGSIGLLKHLSGDTFCYNWFSLYFHLHLLIINNLLQWLTGGTLLSRDKEFIVFYRGKDFLPAAVSSAIEERRKCAIPKEEQGTGYSSSVMTQQECKDGMVDSSHEDEWDGIKGPERNLVSEQKKLGFTEADMNSTRNKLHVVCVYKDMLMLATFLFNSLIIFWLAYFPEQALEKKARAEKLLVELEKGEIPQEPERDKEGITEEERFMLRKVGLRMKPFLLLGEFSFWLLYQSTCFKIFFQQQIYLKCFQDIWADIR